MTCFCSFFGRNWRHQKDILKLTDLYRKCQKRFFRPIGQNIWEMFEKRTYSASVFCSTKRKKSCENKEGKSFQVVLFRYRHLMSRIWIGNEFGELPYDYSTFWQGSLLQLKIIGWKKIGSLFNLLWHKTNMTELSTPILTIFTVSLVVEFQ